VIEQQMSRARELLAERAAEVRATEAAAAAARGELRADVVALVEGRLLDITEIAEATGVSRQSIHAWVREARAASEN
jgi:DNA-directed RNA polymerase specialized sigma24 family protein